MKKITSILLIVLMSVSLVACGSSDTSSSKNEETTQVEQSESKQNEVESFKIGDTTSNDNFEMTLLSVEFADAVNLDKDSENFCMPMSEEERAENQEHSLVGQDGNTLICYSLEYKFIGKTEVKDTFNSYGSVTVLYDTDYTFSADYVDFQKTEEFPEWHFFGTDSKNWETTRDKLGLGKMIWLDGEYKPLEETTYTVRGFIAVPEKVKTDTDSSLEIAFDYLGEKYSIR